MQKALISDLLALSIVAETTKSLKKRQLAKMKAGKVRKNLIQTEENVRIYGRPA